MVQNATSADAIRRAKIHQLLKARFEKHREILEKHKERGPAFKEAVERLERIFNTETST